MIISVTEFKTDLDRYMDLVGEEEIIITKDGRNVARLTPVAEDLETVIRSLRGILPSTATIEEAH